MGRTRIKICGIRDADTALQAADAGADAIGFMFYRESPRYIDPEDARSIMDALPPLVATVGVFVNPSIEKFCDCEEVCPTNYVQLHGQEDEAMVRQCGPWLIRAVRYDPATIRSDLARWDQIDEVDAILVDGSAGGQGVALDWNGLAQAAQGISTPLFLAGGLTPDNVADAIRAVRPYAVDVSSGVESSRGVKDPALIRAFCQAVREADRSIG
ncbi:MAG: N-(5'-phosphoribosyl)anthranilate isomerase [Phycisphaerae bacterium]|nr:N-(5'-phosphoribosyl)anthranilate isomerase [Phycisphaerales bacterium]